MSDAPGPAVPPEEPVAEKTRITTLLLQLVVIPLAVVGFCVALGGLFMWMTSERKDLGDYLKALRATSGPQRTQQARFLLNYIQESKRWQGIFDVTAQISGDRDQFLARHPQAISELMAVFTESANQDPKARRYLAVTLGLLGGTEAVPALRGGLTDADPETVKNCVWALGHLGANEAGPALMELTGHADAGVRMMAVYALGALEVDGARDLLAAALNDPDELVQWNAAFALARRGDDAARMVLQRLLDKEYVDRFTEVTLENRIRYRAAAVEWLVKLEGPAAAAWLEPISVSDPDLRVRNAALRAWNELRQE